MSKDTRRLTLDLPVTVWDALDRMASADDVRIGTYVGRLLVALVNTSQGTGASPSTPVQMPTQAAEEMGIQEPRLPPTSTEWREMNDWLHRTGKRPDLTKEGITTKSGLLAWARRNGFEG
jgi:hypothetical protein